MLNFAEGLSDVMFKFTNIIMYFAPIGVGAAIAYTVGHMGLGILVNLFHLLSLICSINRFYFGSIIARSINYQVANS